MPDNLSADERAAVERVRSRMERTERILNTLESCDMVRHSLKENADLRTLLAVVARAGEAVAWRIDNVAPNASPLARMPFAVWSEEDADRYANDDEKRFTVTPLYAHPADARDRGDASADTRRMDWLESNNEYAIGHPFVAGDSWHLFFNDDGKDVEAPTLRAAIDHAMHAVPAAPEGK